MTTHYQEETLTDKETLDIYFNDIRKYRLLSPAEETDLVARARQDDKQAFEKLVKSNLRFVIKIARQYRHHGIALNDLISEGNMGLIKAIEHFKPEKGFRLITYAVWWIKQYILRAISVQSTMVNIPKNKYWQFQKIRKELDRFEQIHERMPESDEIELIIDMDIDDLDQYYSAFLPAGSHQPLINDEGEEIQVGQGHTNHDRILTEDIQQESLQKELNMILSRLNEYEQKVIRMAFGIDDQAEYSLKEIASELGIPTSKTRRLRESAIRKLRMTGFNNSLREYLGN